MRAGRLRHRITLQTRSATLDAAGNRPAAWTDDATVWGAVEPLSGRELIAAQAAQSEVTHKLTLRWRAGVTAAMRVAFGSRTFEILSLANRDERGAELTLMCKEVT